jgi:uncharacterized membrane protein YphA (DoxX/SURF4 family)
MAVQVIFHILRIGLGALFVWAGAIKIWDFQQGTWATQGFYQDILNYHVEETGVMKIILGAVKGWNMSDLTMLLAIYLPWLEVVTGTALLLRRAVSGGATIVSFLMCVFIAALASAWTRGLDISCGCFGRENATADFPLLLARDCGLLLAALAVAWFERPLTRTASAPPPPEHSA